MRTADPRTRQRLIDDLLRLDRDDLDAVVAEVRSRDNAQEAGIRSLWATFEAGAAESPYSPVSGLLAEEE